MKKDILSTFRNWNTRNHFNNFAFDTQNELIQIAHLGIHNISQGKKTSGMHLHSHSFSELHFSLNGTVVYTMANNSSIQVSKGQWILIPENYPHRIAEYSDNCVKCSCSFAICKELDQSSAYNYIRNVIDANEYKFGTIQSNTLEYISQMFALKFDSHPITPLILQNITSNMVLSTLSSIYTPLPKATEKEKTDPRLEVAIQFIKDNLYRHINSEDVARKVYISLKQLNRIFSSHLSITVAEFIFEQKCAEAKRLLEHSTLSAKEISERLGFSTPSYFNRFFKKHAGITPNEFRLAQKATSMTQNEGKDK